MAVAEIRKSLWGSYHVFSMLKQYLGILTNLESLGRHVKEVYLKTNVLERMQNILLYL